MSELNLGSYSRLEVCGVPTSVRPLFDLGFRLFLAYQHELAGHVFLHCLAKAPDAALVHGLVALCHAPNYNFQGTLYYDSGMTLRPEEATLDDAACQFPSQELAKRHAALGVQVATLRKTKMRDIDATLLAVEEQLLLAIELLLGTTGLDAKDTETIAGRPYANAMRKLHKQFPNDPDITYLFCDSLMVLNAWQLYAYPSGNPKSPDVAEIRSILAAALPQHPDHPGLLHLHIHAGEMAPNPALGPSVTLRTLAPDAGHLVHMPTHIDVLLGDYAQCVASNEDAVRADRQMLKLSPATSSPTAFYFFYIVHDYHMAVYGAVLGGFESKALLLARELQSYIPESVFAATPAITGHLESFAALEIEVLVRFGRWQEILGLSFPTDRSLMLSQTAELLFARAVALAVTGNVAAAAKEAEEYEAFIKEHEEEASKRILHNNAVSSILHVNSVMLKGELLYRQGKYEEGFWTLRKAVELQDNLNFDEPWGKMQPIRHALGGLLLEQGHVDEAIAVFRTDLQRHPKNPWASVGLLAALRKKHQHAPHQEEIAELEQVMVEYRNSHVADFDIVVPCECCEKSTMIEKPCCKV